MMSKDNNGGTAFPLQADISLRDWFAGMALVGLLSRGTIIPTNKAISAYAYEAADLMLAERVK